MNTVNNVLILSISYIKRDNRVLKHIHFFKNAGYSIFAYDLNSASMVFKPLSLREKIQKGFYLLLNKKKLIDMYCEKWKPAIQDVPYSVVIANDWNTLPLAYEYARKNNAVFIYDSHEYATREWEESLKWRLTVKPLITLIEKTYIKYADIISTVCEPIAEELKSKYNLNEVLVVKNVPLTNAECVIPERIYNYPIQLYHHGGCIPQRRLDVLCDAVCAMKGRFILNLRLVGDISELMKKYSNSQFIKFLPVVEPFQLVEKSVNYHVGLHVLAHGNYNYRIALPNKFFEYIHAGLPIITTAKDLSVAAIVKRYDIGFYAKKYTYKSLIELFSQLTPEKLQSKICNVNKIRSIFNAEKEWQQIISKIDEIRKNNVRN